MKCSQKKGISFSGKKSIRVFSGEEEPRAWDKSFEISDHLNVNDTPTIICPPIQNSQKISEENKENIYEEKDIEQVESYNPNKNSANLSISNISGLRPSNEFINITDQLTRNCQIENSVDITLHENEKMFQKKVEDVDENNQNLFSFSLEENVKDIQFGEKTCDFMRDLKNDSKEREESSKTCNENESKTQNNNLTTNRNIMTDESMMYYMSESLSVKSVTQNSSTKNSKRKSVYEVADMQLTLNESQDNDKENVFPLFGQEKNKTQICSSQIEIDEEMLSPSKERQKSSKDKLRPTIYFNKQLETTTMTKDISTLPKELEKTMVIENAKISRPSIYFNQTIDADGTNHDKMPSLKANPCWSPRNSKEITLEKSKTLRQSIYFNQTMDIDEQTATNNEAYKKATISEAKLAKNIEENYAFKNRKTSRPSIYFNKTMDIDDQTAKNNENNKSLNAAGSLTKNSGEENASESEKTSRSSIYFNKTMDMDHQTAMKGKNDNGFERKVTTYITPKMSEMEITLEKQTILRPSVYLDQTMNIDVQTAENAEDNTKKAELEAKSPKPLKETIALKSTKPVRSSIYFNQSIEAEIHAAVSRENNPATAAFKRPSIYFNQSIDIDNQTATNTENNYKGAVPKVKSSSPTKILPENMALENTRNLRPSIYFDQSIDTDAHTATNSGNKNLTEIKDNIAEESTKTTRPSKHFNQSMDIDVRNKTNDGSVRPHLLPKHLQENIALESSKILRPSIHFNQTIDTGAETVTESGTNNKGQPRSIILNQAVETSPVTLGRKTINVNEDMDTSQLTTENAPSCKNQNVSENTQIIQKSEQPAKIAFRRICLPTPNKGRSIFDVPQKRMLQLTQDQKENAKVNQFIDGETAVTANNENSAMADLPKHLRETQRFENIETINPTTYFNQSNENNNKIAAKSENNKMFAASKPLQENMANHLRQSIYFNQSIDTDALTEPIKEKNINEPQERVTSESVKNIRPSIYYNQSIDIVNQTKSNTEIVSPLHENIAKESSKIVRQSIHFNQYIKTDTQTAANNENMSVMHKTNPSSIILNQPVEASPVNLGSNLLRKTINVNEDMDMSHVTPIPNKNATVQKQDQPAKIVFRKICLPTPIRAKNIYDIQTQFGKANEQKEAKNDIKKKLEKSLNFSLESFKNMSLVSDNSSPLIPLEFKGYTLRQLHDEIEAGKIKVFENATKTPMSNRKKFNYASGFQPGDNNYFIEDTQISQNKPLLFENVDIPTTSNKCKYRYSQADEIMLDNTSFLARAKLSDETMSQKSSKRDSTQFNDSMDVFDETLAEAASKLGEGGHSSLKIKDICNQESEPFMQPVYITEETNIKDAKNATCFDDTMNLSAHLQQEDEIKDIKGNDNASISIRFLQRAKGVQDSIRQQNICSENPDNKINNENPSRKTLYFDNRIPLEDTLNEMQEIDLNKNTNTCRKTLFFETKIQEESILNDDKNKDAVIVNLRPPRKTLHYNEEISIETPNIGNPQDAVLDASESCLPQQTKRKTILFEEKIPEESLLKESECDLAQTRKTVYYNNEISPEKNTTLNERNNVDNEKLKNEKIMDVTFEELDLSKQEPSKNLVLQDKISERRKSVYTPENMDITVDGDLQNKSGLQEVEDQVIASEYFADENKSIDELDQSYKPAENYKFPEPSESFNAAKMFLSRRYTKTSFVTPKKSFPKNSAIFMTPRLSLLEFERLEEEQQNKHEHENLYKRNSINLTPVISIAKKKQTLVFNNSLEDAVEVIRDKNEPKIVNLYDSVLKKKEPSPFANKKIEKENEPQIVDLSNSLTEKKDTLAFGNFFKDAKEEVKEKVEQQIVNLNAESLLVENTQKEIDCQLEVESDNLAESIQLMRRATTFTKHEDIIVNEQFSPHLPKQSIFEGNPITISDVSVFFESQRKSHYEITQKEMNITLENPNTFLNQQAVAAKQCFEPRFLNLPDEDLEKTHLSLVREDEEEDNDGTANINDLKQQESSNKEQTLEKHEFICSNVSKLRKERNSVNYLRNESLICRKCKRCQETLLSETTSTESGSFVLPELPPLPDIGLERLRSLRKRPSIADVHVWWQRLSLDLTTRNSNIFDEHDAIDFDEEPENENSVVTKTIRKFHEDMKSYKAKLQQSSPIKSLSPKMPFVMRLSTLLRENCKNWIFDYQSQIRGTFFFSHRMFYIFTLMLKYEKVDIFDNEITVKSIKLENGHVQKKKLETNRFRLGV